MGAAVSLGITRFAYGLLLPPMRADLQWTLHAGRRDEHRQCARLPARRAGHAGADAALRAVAAAGVRARRWPACSWRRSGFFTAAPALLLQRLLAGAGERLRVHRRRPAGGAAGRAAALAQRLPARPVLRRHRASASLLSALLVPPVLEAAAGGRMAGPGPGGRWRWPASPATAAAGCGRRARCRAGRAAAAAAAAATAPARAGRAGAASAGRSPATRCSASATSAT